MNYIERKKSILTGKENLEPLYLFSDFPVFMGCTDEPAEKDLKADMSFTICPETGIIQLDKLLPLEIVYLAQHNDGTGKVWQEHYEAFADFLTKFQPKKVLEIGGANDSVVKNFLAQNPEAEWTIVEPHPLFEPEDRIKIIPTWFDENFTLEETVDTVVHSHVLEHAYDPAVFMTHIGQFLKKGKRHIFTLPNLVEFLQKKYTNALNFEHTCFLAEPFVDYLLEKNGFTILEKQYFHDHSIFYATEKKEERNSELVIPNKYEEYKQLFLEFIQYHQDLVAGLNQKIQSFDGPVYVFGAHIFSQYLFEFGLQQEKLTALLDNSSLKQGKRLYGTSLLVSSPESIRDQGKVAVVLKVAGYRTEILDQLLKINPEVVIFE